MIRRTTVHPSTILHYQEGIAAWLRCKKMIRGSFQEAVITLQIGDQEQTGWVPISCVHPALDLALARVTGEQDGHLVIDFAPAQDEPFRVMASEEHLDAICAKTEILRKPVSEPPEE